MSTVVARIRAVISAETNSFVELVKLAGLDRTRAFRFADLRNVDLSGEDLGGFDLRGADLSGAKLAGANISNALWDDSTVLSESQIEQAAGQKLSPKLDEASILDLFRGINNAEVFWARVGRANAAKIMLPKLASWALAFSEQPIGLFSDASFGRDIDLLHPLVLRAAGDRCHSMVDVGEVINTLLRGNLFLSDNVFLEFAPNLPSFDLAMFAARQLPVSITHRTLRVLARHVEDSEQLSQLLAFGSNLERIESRAAILEACRGFEPVYQEVRKRPSLEDNDLSEWLIVAKKAKTAVEAESVFDDVRTLFGKHRAKGAQRELRNFLGVMLRSLPVREGVRLLHENSGVPPLLEDLANMYRRARRRERANLATIVSTRQLVDELLDEAREVVEPFAFEMLLAACTKNSDLERMIVSALTRTAAKVGWAKMGAEYEEKCPIVFSERISARWNLAVHLSLAKKSMSSPF